MLNIRVKYLALETDLIPLSLRFDRFDRFDKLIYRLCALSLSKRSGIPLFKGDY